MFFESTIQVINLIHMVLYMHPTENSTCMHSHYFNSKCSTIFIYDNSFSYTNKKRLRQEGATYSLLTNMNEEEGSGRVRLWWIMPDSNI